MFFVSQSLSLNIWDNPYDFLGLVEHSLQPTWTCGHLIEVVGHPLRSSLSYEIRLTTTVDLEDTVYGYLKFVEYPLRPPRICGVPLTISHICGTHLTKHHNCGIFNKITPHLR